MAQLPPAQLWHPGPDVAFTAAPHRAPPPPQCPPSSSTSLSLPCCTLAASSPPPIPPLSALRPLRGCSSLDTREPQPLPCATPPSPGSGKESHPPSPQGEAQDLAHTPAGTEGPSGGPNRGSSRHPGRGRRAQPSLSPILQGTASWVPAQ